jgi:hypothetical protein
VPPLAHARARARVCTQAAGPTSVDRKLSRSSTRLAGELNAEERDKEARVLRFFCHPNQPFRTVWDGVQVVLLLYLLVAVPLRVAFDVDVEFNTFAFWFDVGVDIYFITDVVVNFRTAFYNKGGILEIDLRTIAIEYLKTWLVLDILTCFPVTYIIMLIKWDTDGGDGGRNVKVFRVLRCLCLLSYIYILYIYIYNIIILYNNIYNILCNQLPTPHP